MSTLSIDRSTLVNEKYELTENRKRNKGKARKIWKRQEELRKEKEKKR